MLIVAIVLFPATFIYAPYYLATYMETSVKDPKNASLVVVYALIGLWLIHLCCGRFCNESASYLHNL